ncbi:hybrid sensor histidine kinase/response regulator [Almyronema epifaneia]|uniref:histidine kinase n=1 Tax=Almyronema epifaneia S1 TaxID=2991925 RepID=A0ABW6IJB8_9CYAN
MSHRILVVEDEAITREVLIEQLSDLGYVVVGVTAFGSEALSLVAKTQPDIVLMDIKLGENDVDGITAASWIKEQFSVPIVYLTANADADTLDRAKLTEPLGYILKPFSERSLQASIETAIYNHQQIQKSADCNQKAATSMRQLLETEKELSQLKDRVIATISHEYKTPLAVILSSSELLREYRHRFSPEQINNHFDAIRNSVKLLSDLVEELTFFKQTQSKAFVYDPQPLDLADFCQDLLMYYQLASNGRHQLQLKVQPASLKPVLLDKKLLRYILSNLLSNAIKYSPAGGQVTLSCALVEQQIVLSVADQGIGIDPDDLQQLFKPFFRAHNAAAIKGTGMGLSIAKNCVELHGGEIRVESQPHQGSLFSVYLPLVWVIEDATEPSTNADYPELSK